MIRVPLVNTKPWDKKLFGTPDLHIAELTT